MCISKLTILEMFAHPNDLYFVLVRPAEKEQHALLISRGPGTIISCLLLQSPALWNEMRQLLEWVRF